MVNDLREMVDVGSLAEKDLKSILEEINLQNEKLVGIQQKIGTTQSHLLTNSKAIDDMIRAAKPKVTIGIMSVLITSVVLLYVRFVILDPQ